MRYLLRLRDMPELAHLTHAQRRRVLRSVPIRDQVWLVGCPIMVGLIVTSTVALTIGFDGFACIILAITMGLLAIGAMRVLLVHICRNHVRRVLLEAERSGLLTVCLRCGYDLTNITADRCPECGRVLPAGGGVG